MARMSRPESQARTRAELVRTARDLFVADGLANTSLARVADAAGYSKGAVYSNFRSKNELCLEVVELIHVEAMSGIDRLRGRNGTRVGRLGGVREWMRANVEATGRNRLDFELTLAAQEDPRLRDQLRANRSAIQDALAGLLAEIAGAEVSESFRDAAKTVFSLGMGLGVQRLADATIAPDPIMTLLPGLLAGAEGLKDVQSDPAHSSDIEKRSNRGSASGRGDESRAALLDAAVTVFRAKRFDEVSTTEIAQRAGVAIGLINYHFGGKRGLYLAAAEAVSGDFWDRLQSLRGPAVSRLIRGLDLYLDTAEEFEGSPLALSTRVPDVELRAIQQRQSDRLIDALMLEINGGAGTPLARTAVAGWLAFVEGTVTEWLRTRDLSRVQLRELLVASLFATGQAVLTLAPETPLSSRAISALLDRSQLPTETTEYDE
ncbi:TetR/AcrR family transcriptional regulator [Nocardia huaxiensis]|uniref:TetR/AcrR family transcriptional regulator n=1 Tax=Nocardia huaxiensis TaxID=2755382 RepID=UPI001E468F36|nr:TetR/AcrR family transcriptional regulator [Nocardia huaxiensis]UFS99668.1 TetR/AcrR family transcriptional regulator [Nocardia huaxiensis]